MVDYLVFITGLFIFRDSPVHLIFYLLVSVVVYLIGIYRNVKGVSERSTTGQK